MGHLVSLTRKGRKRGRRFPPHRNLLRIGAACPMAQGEVMASGWRAWCRVHVPAALVCGGGVVRVNLARCYGAARHAIHRPLGWGLWCGDEWQLADNANPRALLTRGFSLGFPCHLVKLFFSSSLTHISTNSITDSRSLVWVVFAGPESRWPCRQIVTSVS